MPKATITLLEIKQKVKDNQGRKVRLEAHKSKKKLYHKTGYIDEIYPSIFTISIEGKDDGSRVQHMSFSYIDLLTHNVKIDLVDANGVSTSL